jgi:hypothetical protein
MDTIKMLESVLVSLKESAISASDFDFGPSYERATTRREAALKDLQQYIRELHAAAPKGEPT